MMVLEETLRRAAVLLDEGGIVAYVPSTVEAAGEAEPEVDLADLLRWAAETIETLRRVVKADEVSLAGLGSRVGVLEVGIRRLLHSPVYLREECLAELSGLVVGEGTTDE